MRRGRPTIGGTPREKRVTVRLTAQEEEALIQRFGTPGKGLRFLLADFMRMKGKSILRADASASPGGEKEKGVPRPEEQDRSPKSDIDVKVKGGGGGGKGTIITAGEVAPTDIERKTSSARAEALRAVAAGTHRHKPEGEPIRVEYVQGVEKKVYVCVCGKEMKR